LHHAGAARRADFLEHRKSSRYPSRIVKDAPDPPAAAGTQLLDRAIAVLQRLGEAGERGERLTAIAQSVGLNVSTAHRILGALERHGLAERETATRRHKLGVALFALGAQAADGPGLRFLCRPAMLRIAAATDETVFLMVRSGLNAVVVDRQQGSYVIETLTQNVGGLIPLGIGSGSLAILAFLPEEEAKAILDANAVRYQPFGDTPESIRITLAKARRQGYVARQSPHIKGISAVAIPIRPPGRAVSAALAINMTTARLGPGRLEELLELLRQEVAPIEETLAIGRRGGG
jgi:DNA-binding IclR family transcriptional regulator